MADKQYPKCLYLPAKGRPRLIPSDCQGWELLYFSWGRRWFARDPIPPARHEGWVYIAILAGSPSFCSGGQEHEIPAGQVVMIHPECAYGWSDRPGRECRILCWMWRSMPQHRAIEPPAGKWRTIGIDRQTLKKLEALGVSCQKDVARADDLAWLSLQKTKLELDLLLARSLRQNPAPEAGFRMQLALEFLNNHLADREPVAKLAEYLQISPTALKELFHGHLQESPKAVVLGMRMHQARKRLEQDAMAVKQVALELGYRHANDLSRAFKRFFGITPRDCSKTGGK